jgi:hypothetical protein
MTYFTQNGNLPSHFYGNACSEILRGLDEQFVGQYEPCVVFGVTSIPSRALHFSILCECGAQWARIPIHMLRHGKEPPAPDAPRHALSDLQCWDNHGWSFSIIAYDYLREMACSYRQRDGKMVPASYLATLDWLDNGYSDYPPEHKCAHLLLLEDGSQQIAAQPNNRILWQDHSFGKPSDAYKTYKVMADTTWRAEADINPQDTAMTQEP